LSFQRRRGRSSPPTEDVSPELFFGEADRSQRKHWKALQLCKQVERAAAMVLSADCQEEVLAGAAVAAVLPAPDAARLMVRVVLAPGRAPEDVGTAREALGRAAARFREEVARSIHRKRVPEIVFDVWLAEEMRDE
jgi:ribosome-binding factor A